MSPDPYRAPTAEIDGAGGASQVPILLLLGSSLLLLAIAAWCFYLSNALSTLSARDSVKIENIERVSRQIREGETRPSRERMTEYFERNREFLLADIGYQRSAQLNFILVGAGLVLTFSLQLGLVLWLRRGARLAPSAARGDA